MIWFALIIPLIAIVFLSLRYSCRIHIVEYILLFSVPLVCVIVGKVTSVHSQTHDTEYWNSFGTSAIYEEEWNERVSCRHPKYVTKTRRVRDSNGNYHTETYSEQQGYQHLYDVDHHPPKWTLYDNIANGFSISKDFFEGLCKTWKSRVFKDMNRSYHTIDGDAYVTEFDKQFDHIVSICEQHTYENRVQCSKSVFNFEKIDAETVKNYGLFDYPPENLFEFSPILGCTHYEANVKLQRYNAINGAKRLLHMFLLVFNNQPIEAGTFQESYWKGGNKNEFIVCVGLNSNGISWTKVISWTDNEELKVRIAREIKEMKEFNPLNIVTYMGENIPPTFVKKNFRDFNYISIRPTNRAILITYIITIITTLIISIISVRNNFDYGSGI